MMQDEVGGLPSASPAPPPEAEPRSTELGDVVPLLEQPAPRQPSWLRARYEAAALPVTVLRLFRGTRVHPSYRMTRFKMFKLARRMLLNTRRIGGDTSYRADLAMGVKLLETSPETEGVVVQCGCGRGASAANLSLVCEIVDRAFIGYDSVRGDLDVVRENVRRYGAIDRCQFREGWFKDTLPSHEQPIALCFLDVDGEAALYDCVVNTWRHLARRAYMFVDQCSRLDYCALFFSSTFWHREFNAVPPGLIGAGAGLGLGQYFLGSPKGRPRHKVPTSIAYARKGFSAVWGYVRNPAQDDMGFPTSSSEASGATAGQKLVVPRVFSHGFHYTSDKMCDSGARLIMHMCRKLGLDDLGQSEVLDVGCGTKFTQALINRALPIKSYVGVDVDRDVIDFHHANVNDPRFEHYHWDVRNDLYNPDGPALTEGSELPFDERTFDVICLFSVFTHLDPHDYRVLLSVLRRYIKPGGKLFYTLYLDELSEAGYGLMDVVAAAAGRNRVGRISEFEDLDAAEYGLPHMAIYTERPLMWAVYSPRYARELIAGTGWELLRTAPPDFDIQHQFICGPARGAAELPAGVQA